MLSLVKQLRSATFRQDPTGIRTEVHAVCALEECDRCERLAAAGAGLSDHARRTGFDQAARWAAHCDLTSPGLSLMELREINRRVLDPTWSAARPSHALPNEAPGAWRRQPLPAFPVDPQPPDPVLIPALIRKWIRSTSVPGADVVEHVADCTHALLRIHPFLDGNGRTARIVADLLLLRHRRRPALLQAADHDCWLASLRYADAGDLVPLMALLSKN